MSRTSNEGWTRSAAEGSAQVQVIDCRSGCGACCIAPSISAPMPGFPAGKLAGVRCPHLTEDIRCALFGSPERPSVCRDLKPQPEMCGASAEEAMATLSRWEIETSPAR